MVEFFMTIGAIVGLLVEVGIDLWVEHLGANTIESVTVGVLVAIFIGLYRMDHKDAATRFAAIVFTLGPTIYRKK